MKFIHGDFTESNADAFAHGCNAQGVMGSGAALTVKKKWPWNYEEYKKWCDEYPLNIGDYYIGNVIPGDSHSKPIINIITQIYYGKDGVKYAQYSALVLAFHYIDLKDIKTIAIPKIGAGLGGLKWEFVQEILQEIEDMNSIEFWVYEL
jgi:O-acetyl-ADP-ribose deacetylase (regulator of RNase III)